MNPILAAGQRLAAERIGPELTGRYRLEISTPQGWWPVASSRGKPFRFLARTH